MMLNQPTIETLRQLKLTGMVKALLEQQENQNLRSLDFEERLGLMVERERIEQENRLMESRLRRAKLGQSAPYENLDLRSGRGLDKSLLASLSTCSWIRSHHNLIITGPTGVGKSYLACALGHKACREGLSVIYQRAGRLFYELGISRGDGRYLRQLKSLGQAELLILDDWGLAALQDEQRRDLLELAEERHSRKSTLIVSQIPIEKWHDLIGESTIADAVLDRLVHNAHKISMKGDSMRKQMAKTLNLT
jgi:DNA replication protein DnaC